MNTFKEKCKRFFNKNHAASFGALACAFSVLVSLVQMGYYVSLGETLSDFLYNLILTIINCMFYLYLTRDFIRSKETNNLAIASRSLLIITIFDYVIPAIELVFVLAIAGALMLGVFGILLSSSIFGVIYFIFMARENKSIGKNNVTVLLVFGSLILLSNLVASGLYIAMGVLNIYSNAANLTIDCVLLSISEILQGIAYILMGLLYLFYPIELRRLKKRGY